MSLWWKPRGAEAGAVRHNERVRSRHLLASLALIAATACSSLGSFGNAPPITSPVALVVWPARALPTPVVRSLRSLEGVMSLRRIGTSTLALTKLRGATRLLPIKHLGDIVPVSVMAIDPEAAAQETSFAEAAKALARGEAVISPIEARLRGLDVGDTFRLDSASRRSAWFKVGAITKPDAVWGDEIVIPLSAWGRLGLRGNRAVVLRVAAEKAGSVAQRIPSLLGGIPARIRPANTRENDGGPMLSTAEMKSTFGEFTFRRVNGYVFRPDPAWVDRNIVQARLPVLGLVACHRLMLPQLGAAMRELVAKGLSKLVYSVDGCWSPRMQFGNRSAISRHAFGAAIDLNYVNNQYGETPHQDRRLVEIMERWGFVWGGRWMIPDGMHFEFVRFAR
jgi:D-alanyl-D-alanine carboxypeptidase-like protein